MRSIVEPTEGLSEDQRYWFIEGMKICLMFLEEQKIEDALYLIRARLEAEKKLHDQQTTKISPTIILRNQSGQIVDVLFLEKEKNADSRKEQKEILSEIRTIEEFDSWLAFAKKQKEKYAAG